MAELFRCDEHARALAEVRTELRAIKVSSRATLVAAILTPLGAVAVAVVAGWFALAQTREQSGLRAEEAARQEVVGTRVRLDVEQLRKAYALGREDGHADGRVEALSEAMAASKREGVALATPPR
jgi:hypothetical protein